MKTENGKQEVQGGIVQQKSLQFAIRVAKFCNFLQSKKHEYIVSKQIFRSGTSVGANIRESRNAQSKLDFVNKLNIALKEADETQYWLELLYGAKYIDEKEYDSMNEDVKQIIALLTASIKTLKSGSGN